MQCTHFWLVCVLRLAYLSCFSSRIGKHLLALPSASTVGALSQRRLTEFQDKVTGEKAAPRHGNRFLPSGLLRKDFSVLVCVISPQDGNAENWFPKLIPPQKWGDLAGWRSWPTRWASPLRVPQSPLDLSVGKPGLGMVMIPWVSTQQGCGA